jgi:hypothetical protein
MEFYVAKCKVMHLGNNNIRQAYQINRQQPGITEEEVDIDVAMVGSLKPSVQCRTAARTAQTVLGQLARGIRVCESNLESLAGGRQRVLGAVLWNRNYFLRFRFRLLKSYGCGSSSDF